MHRDVAALDTVRLDKTRVANLVGGEQCRATDPGGGLADPMVSKILRDAAQDDIPCHAERIFAKDPTRRLNQQGFILDQS